MLFNRIWKYGLNLLGIGDKKPDPEEMPVAAIKLLAFFSVAMGAVLLASNLAALKIWGLPIPLPTSWFPFKKWEIVATLPMDAGVWLFPLSYIIGDLLVNIYGEKMANLVAVFSALFAVIAAAVFWFAKLLWDFPGVDNSAFAVVQSATGRIFLASVIGFLAGQITNNYYFVLLRAVQNLRAVQDERKAFRNRALISSAFAHIVDSVLFEFLAFWGRISMSDFIVQLVLAMVAAFAIEAMLSWRLTPWLALKLDQKLKYHDGKRKE